MVVWYFELRLVGLIPLPHKLRKRDFIFKP